jgi:hypothetical protein
MPLETEPAITEAPAEPTGLVYLATPYSHDDLAVRERRFAIANRVAADLMRSGVHVFSPISHTHPIAMAGELPKGWDFWEAFDRTVLAACVKVIVLRQPGWEQSTGVRAELGIAREIGLPIEFMDPPTPNPQRSPTMTLETNITAGMVRAELEILDTTYKARRRKLRALLAVLEEQEPPPEPLKVAEIEPA